MPKTTPKEQYDENGNDWTGRRGRCLTALLGGCAVYPYPAGPGPAVAVAPAPVYVGPPAVVVSPRPYYGGYGYYGRRHYW
ncbi:hypothetical protein ACTMU2_33980 [Cupriavidus basilensis]